ncbi:NHLP bacteriocin export ABC transporter permease/ATPase subunit [soil metagenome]
MNAPLAAGNGAIDLAVLAAPGRLTRAVRLYAVVLDDAGNPGGRRFVAELPEGAAVFAMVVPGVAFLLHEHAAPDLPLISTGPIDAAGLDAWYQALLAAPGLEHSDAQAVPLSPGDRQSFTAGASVTARQIVWLAAATPILRYPEAPGIEASPTMSRLVMADQISIEVIGEGEVQALDSAAILEQETPEALGALSTTLAQRIATAFVRRDAHQRQRWKQTQEVDQLRASRAVQRLRDIALFRPATPLPAMRPGQDHLPGVLALLAAAQGFSIRMPLGDDTRSSLFERLKAYAISSGFRFREITLDGPWWKEEGPPFMAIDTESGRPISVLGRFRRWRAVDPETLAETPIDEAAAAKMRPSGYMLYPSLPDTLKGRDIWRFSTFGVGGDIRRLLVTSAAASMAGLLMPVATGSILGIAIPDGRFTLLADMLLLLMAAALGSAGFQVARAMSLIRLGTHLDQRLQAAVWDRVVRLRTSFFRRFSVGDLTERILGIDTIRRTLTGATVNAVIGGVFSLGSLAIMLIYDAPLTAFAVVYALTAGTVLFAVGRVQRRLQQRTLNEEGTVSGLLIELLGGIAKLRVAAAELRAFSRWSDAFAKQRVASAGARRMAAVQTIAAGSLPFIGAIGIYFIAGGGANPIDVGSFAAFNSAFGQFTSAILWMATALNSSIDILPLYSRIRPIFEAPLEVQNDRIDPGALGGSIAVRDLSFRYTEDGPWVLQNVNFEMRPGESVAIVGASGSGKSTVLRLLLGLETPTRGGVFYDGKDLEELDLRLVRRQIGTVLEGSTLFPGSLYENIAGSSPLTREQVAEAVRLAGLEADIEAMPMGLNSAVTEGGSQISGGQRQRVMIARALVNRPRLLFFDEATSALDNHTQAIVAESVAKMNATRIVVAHRMSTIRNVDRIIVLESGRVVETGTYNELVDKGGPFQHLAQRQLL